MVNQHLLHDLTCMGLWNPELKNELVAANGSVQELDIPMHLKASEREQGVGGGVGCGGGSRHPSSAGPGGRALTCQVSRLSLSRA